MRTKLLALALLGTTAVAGCMQQPVNANCAIAGAAGGAALGAATNNNVAQSALVGGALGVAAGSTGLCN